MNDITILIPAYNASRYLGEAIRSAFRAFRCSGDQIIVVDDGSADETSQVALRAGVRCIRHPSNRGIASGLNTAIAAANTEYVAWLSADDLYTDNAGESIQSAMDLYPGADLYFGGFCHMDRQGQIFPVAVENGLDHDFRGLIRTDWFVDLLFGCFINGATTVMKRHRLVELGLFDSSSRYVQDYSMWMLMAYHRSSAVFIDEVVGLRRIHEGQLSWNPQVRKIILRENHRLLDRYLTEESVRRIDERFKDMTLEPDDYRIRLVKRLLQVGLYHKAWKVARNLDDIPGSFLALGRDLSGVLHRKLAAVIRH